MPNYYTPSPQMAALIKQQLFGNWAPEDQEWGLQEFLKDGNTFNGHFQDLQKAEQALQSGNQKDAAAWLGQAGTGWFNTQGHAKTKARNETRDAGGGYLPGDPRYKSPEQREQEAAAAKQAGIDKEAADAQGRTNQINADLDAFYKLLSQPIDPNDPEIQRVASMAGRSAVGQAFGSGVEGGLSVANTERAAGAAASDMFQRERERRQGLATQVGGLRASGALNQQQFQQSQQQLQEANRRYAEGLRYDDAMNQYNFGMQQRQGAGGIVGGILGALPGLIPGVGPELMKYTLPAGMQMGAGGAGLMYRPPPRRNQGGY